MTTKRIPRAPVFDDDEIEALGRIVAQAVAECDAVTARLIADLDSGVPIEHTVLWLNDLIKAQEAELRGEPVSLEVH